LASMPSGPGRLGGPLNQLRSAPTSLAASVFTQVKALTKRSGVSAPR
jgi:hypothetical protein